VERDTLQGLKCRVSQLMSAGRSARGSLAQKAVQIDRVGQPRATSESMLGMRGVLGRNSGSERCWRTVRIQDCGSNPKTRNSWLQRQAFASRAAHTTAFSREGSSSTVKPPLSGGAHG
jgi:hypothetical protein